MRRVLGHCVGVAALLGSFASTALAIPVGWTCTGACGTLGADGVVTAPPGGTTYEFVTTSGGVALGGNDLNIGSETNGSRLLTGLFSAAAGQSLEFDFNYVTSDGTASYVEYAWARLLDSSEAPVALLFTARTTPSGDTVPGFGLPPISATMTPSATPIIHGAPTWSPLGGSSGDCFGGTGAGCGYTGWIHSSFAIPSTGNYFLEFGVVNWGDQAFDSGLAIASTTIGGAPIGPPTDLDPIPEPASLLLLGSGLAAGVRRMMKKRKTEA